MDAVSNFGLISVLPAATVIILALWTRRTFEPLLAGAIVGFIIVGKANFFGSFIGAIYEVMMGEVTAWVILVCGLFGSLVALMERSGGAMGFSGVAAKVAKGEKTTGIVTWLLGIAVFADDYLNALAVGTAMRKLADKYRIAREFLAFIVNSTGAPVCCIIPVSTWAAFMAGQLAIVGVATESNQTAVYIQTIPYQFYCLIAVAIVPLYILKVIPMFGPVRKADKRAKETGQTLPDSTFSEMKEAGALEEQTFRKKPNVWNFVIPMILLVGFTIYFSDMLYGVIISIVSCVVLFLPQRVMTPREICEAVIDGFKDMVFPLMIVVAAFILQNANDALGLTPYVIETVKPILSPAVLPMISFIVVGALAFCTGSFWGVAAIAFPIIIPLAQTMGVNVMMACGAVISGAVFGSHSCFYSDAATLTCTSTQIKNADYARNVLPLIGTPLVLGIIAFLIGGIVAA